MVQSIPEVVTISLEELARLVSEDKQHYQSIDRGYCDLTKMFSTVKILDKHSASVTSQALVQINPKVAPRLLKNYVRHRQRHGLDPHLFVKIVPVYDDRPLTSLEYEIIMYKYLYVHFIQRRVTPNIMQLLMVLECDSMLTDFTATANNPQTPPELAAKYQQMIRGWTKRQGWTDTLMQRTYGQLTDQGRMMIVESGSGKSLRDLIEDRVLSSSDLHAIVFQVLYTLNEMYYAGIKHNDLHLGNVWIQLLPNPRTLHYYYASPGSNQLHHFVITTRYLVKIYDFDRSTFTKRNAEDVSLNNSNNLTRSEDEFCKVSGECNIEDARFDIFRFTSHLISVLDNPKYRYKHIAWDLIYAIYPDIDNNQNPLVETIMGGEEQIALKFSGNGRWTKKALARSGEVAPIPVEIDAIRTFDDLQGTYFRDLIMDEIPLVIPEMAESWDFYVPRARQGGPPIYKYVSGLLRFDIRYYILKDY